MPPTRLILGDLPALEHALAAEITAARAADPLAPVTVLVGHVLLRPYLRRALARRGIAQLNVRFVPADELAQSMSAAAETDPRPRLAPAVERLLVREVSETASGYFSAIAGREGFADALRQLFREIELAGFTEQSLARAFGDDAADERSKLGQIARLYMEYRERRGNFGSIADHIARAFTAPFDGPLLVYGLWRPAEMQARLIDNIAQRARVTVFLPESGIDGDDAHAAFRARLQAAGATIERLPSAAPAIARRLFRAAPAHANGSAPASPDIALVSAPDTVREAWEAARTCLAWARDGIPFHEMAVVYRNRDPYRDLVAEIFAEAGIETYLHEGRMLATHPLGRRVLRLLDLAQHHETFPRAGVMEFLTETELPRATVERYGRVRPSEWETYTREAGVVEGAAQWQERLQRLHDEKIDESRHENMEWLVDVAQRIATLTQFAGDLHDALASRPAEATWDGHLAFLRRLAETYAANTAPVIDALEDLRQLAAVRERVSFDVFCRAVRDDFESRDTSRVLNEPIRMFGRQGVAVLDATSVRHLRFRAVYLLGVAERAWPAPRRPDALLLEHERRRINAAGRDTLPLRTEPDDETLTFWLAAQSATEHLALSYARADAGRSGKHLPSYFFRAVVEALEGRRLTLDEVDVSQHVRRVEAGRLAAPVLEHALSDAEYDRGLVKRANEGAAPAALDAIATGSPAFGAAMRARRDRWSRALTPYDGVMTNAAAISAAEGMSSFAQGRAVSPSRLELYATCPYRYFMRHALRIEPLKEPEAIDRIDHLQRGTLIHEILQTYLTKLGRDDPPSAARRAEHLPLLLEVSREAGEERVRRGVTGRPLLWEMDRRAIDEDLVRWYDEEAKDLDEGGLLPGAFEARFGPATYGLGDTDTEISTDDPLVLRAGGRDIRVQGRIDRIDWDTARTRFRVIDYKTGKAGSSRTLFKRGEALQLPIYLRAASIMLNIDPLNGEAQYFYVSSRGGYKRHGIDGATLDESNAQFDQTLSAIASGVDAGVFPPNPEHDHCRFCDYKDVCDTRITPIMKRKAGDARGADYIALQEIP